MGNRLATPEGNAWPQPPPEGARHRAGTGPATLLSTAVGPKCSASMKGSSADCRMPFLRHSQMLTGFVLNTKQVKHTENEF